MYPCWRTTFTNFWCHRIRRILWWRSCSIFGELFDGPLGLPGLSLEVGGKNLTLEREGPKYLGSSYDLTLIRNNWRSNVSVRFRFIVLVSYQPFCMFISFSPVNLLILFNHPCLGPYAAKI
jgi:hypothetical protein